jgi:hypothetical protein
MYFPRNNPNLHPRHKASKKALKSKNAIEPMTNINGRPKLWLYSVNPSSSNSSNSTSQYATARI